MNSPSFKNIASLLRSSCIKAELYFAMSSAELFMTFTRKFQRDEPLVHVLYSELCLLLQMLSGRICKSEAIKDIDTLIMQGGSSVFEVKNFLPLSEIVLSSEVKKELTKVTNNDKLHFLK